MKASLLFNIKSTHWREMGEDLQVTASPWWLTAVWIGYPRLHLLTSGSQETGRNVVPLVHMHTPHEQICMCACAKCSHLLHLMHLNAKRNIDAFFFFITPASKRSGWHWGGRMGGDYMDASDNLNLISLSRCDTATSWITDICSSDPPTAPGSHHQPERLESEGSNWLA